jgi:hypothetical protein
MLPVAETESPPGSFAEAILACNPKKENGIGSWRWSAVVRTVLTNTVVPQKRQLQIQIESGFWCF